MFLILVILFSAAMICHFIKESDKQRAREEQRRIEAQEYAESTREEWLRLQQSNID